MGIARSLPVRVAVPILSDHPSDYVVRDFINALNRHGVDPVFLPRRVGALLVRAHVPTPRLGRQLVIVPMMGPRPDVLAAASLYGTPVPFCWDVWQPQWPWWIELLNRVKPPLVITTAKESARHLAANLTSTVALHLPEAVDLGRYDPGGRLARRSIDVLEIGRRNQRWHEAVRLGTRHHGVRHLFERSLGEVVFPGEAALLKGFTDTKVLVCFPSSITHPERSGSVSTLTSRYLEGMASRCLLLGEAPDELSELLGFDPVVPADADDPWTHLKSVLDSIDSYQNQVDMAHETVQSVGGWDRRSRELIGLVRDL